MNEGKWFFINVIICTLCGYLSFRAAQKKKMNPWFGFFVGSLFGLLGLIVIYFFPQKKPSLELPQKSPFTEKQNIFFNNPAFQEKLWHYVGKNKEVSEAISLYKMKSEFQKGKITMDTYIWTEAMSDWKKVKELVDKPTN